MSRIDTIGQNGNDGIHYDEIERPLSYLATFLNVESFACDLPYRSCCIEALNINVKTTYKLFMLYKIMQQPFFNGGTQRVYRFKNEL